MIGHLLTAAARLQRRWLNLCLLGVIRCGFGFLLDNPHPYRVQHHLQTPLGVAQSFSARALCMALLALALSLNVLLDCCVVPLPIQPAVEAGAGSHIVQPIG